MLRAVFFSGGHMPVKGLVVLSLTGVGEDGGKCLHLTISSLCLLVSFFDFLSYFLLGSAH